MLATNGAVVVMDAETGAVIALASNPTYSLDTWVGGISTAAYQNLSAGCQGSSGACPLNDNAIQGLYIPGSTFKLATATAALQTGLITPNTVVRDTGTFTINPPTDDLSATDDIVVIGGQEAGTYTPYKNNSGLIYFKDSSFDYLTLTFSPDINSAPGHPLLSGVNWDASSGASSDASATTRR